MKDQHILRRAWRYQRGNQNTLIEGQTTQCGFAGKIILKSNPKNKENKEREKKKTKPN